MVILIYIIYKRGLNLYALLFGLISKQFKPVLISTGLNCLEIRLDSSARQREILTIIFDRKSYDFPSNVKNSVRYGISESRTNCLQNLIFIIYYFFA